MKRLAAILLISAMLLGVFCGCGNNTEDDKAVWLPYGLEFGQSHDAVRQTLAQKAITVPEPIATLLNNGYSTSCIYEGDSAFEWDFLHSDTLKEYSTSQDGTRKAEYSLLFANWEFSFNENKELYEMRSSFTADGELENTIVSEISDYCNGVFGKQSSADTSNSSVAASWGNSKMSVCIKTSKADITDNMIAHYDKVFTEIGMSSASIDNTEILNADFSVESKKITVAVRCNDFVPLNMHNDIYYPTVDEYMTQLKETFPSFNIKLSSDDGQSCSFVVEDLITVHCYLNSDKTMGAVIGKFGNIDWLEHADQVAKCRLLLDQIIHPFVALSYNSNYSIRDFLDDTGDSKKFTVSGDDFDISFDLGKGTYRCYSDRDAKKISCGFSYFDN